MLTILYFIMISSQYGSIISEGLSEVKANKVDKYFFPKFKRFNIQVNGVTIAGVQANNSAGPAILLLHGHPTSHVYWRLVAEKLATNYTVIASDLRGSGTSSAPPGDARHELYSKRTMAKDQVLLMESLGYKKFALVAHDRGARVGHRMLIDYPDRVTRAIFLDIAPTLAMYEGTNMHFAQAYWLWFFLIQPKPLPEKFIMDNTDFYITNRKHPYAPIALESYKETLSKPEYVHAMCEDYRASATIDLDHERADIAAGRKIQCPLRVLWAAKGSVNKYFKPLDLWSKLAVNVTGRALDSNHDIPIEIPGVLLDEIYKFLPTKPD